MRKISVEQLIGYLLPTALVIHALDTSSFAPEHGRSAVKLISLCIISVCFGLILTSPHGRRISRRNLAQIIIICSCFFCIFVLPEMRYSQYDVIYQLAKILGTFMMLWTLMVSPKITDQVLNTMLNYGLVLAVVAIYSLFFPFTSNEKIPILNLVSSRSLLFEQNVFGIYMFFCFMYFLRYRASSIKTATFLASIFSSFYRTVWALAFLGFVSNSKTLYVFVVASITSIAIILNFDLVFEAFKLSQVKNLTGRVDLWEIGLIGFYESPLIGHGFSQIPDYSNVYLNRSPPYTTFHNAIIDSLFVSGVIGGMAFLVLFLMFIYMVGRQNWFFGPLLLAPMLFNTFFPFSPNILGGFIAAYAINIYQIRFFNKPQPITL